MKYIATVDGTDVVIDVEQPAEILVDGAPRQVDLRSIDGVHFFSLIVDDESFELHAERERGVYYIQIGGDRYAVEVEQERLKRLKDLSAQTHEEIGTAVVLAPMPGLVVRVLVEQGDEVEEGQGLVILEAMKMENEIRSPRSGTIRAIYAAPGNAVNKDDQLAVIVDAGAGPSGPDPDIDAPPRS